MTRMLWLLTCSTLLFNSLGCQSIGDLEIFSLGEETAPYKKPMELVSFWADGVEVQLDPRQGGTPMPGFSGRVIFHHLHASKPAETVAVDGTLLIQLFEENSNMGSGKPLETWTILPEHLPLLMKRDMSGWGYALWLPWTSCNPAIRSGKLIVKYTGKDGTVLQGAPMQIHMSDPNQGGGLAKPRLDVQRFNKNTWQ